MYYGVAQYDKDKKPIAGNKALNYFVTNNSTVPQNSVWNKYSGTITLATSHTPYSTSDGGPVRYVQTYVIVNYQTGTIPTNYRGILLRRATPFRDSGAVSFNGNVGIGTKSPQTALDANGRIRAFGWGTEPTSGTSLEL